jgi:hypothetical protein
MGFAKFSNLFAYGRNQSLGPEIDSAIYKAQLSTLCPLILPEEEEDSSILEEKVHQISMFLNNEWRKMFKSEVALSVFTFL